MLKKPARQPPKPVPPPPGPPAGEIHAREMRLLASDTNTDKLVADMVKNATPPGWTARKAEPPWTTTSGACRSCGEGVPPLSVALLTLARAEQCELLYTFSIVCKRCVNQPDKILALKVRAFPL